MTEDPRVYARAGELFDAAIDRSDAEREVLFAAANDPAAVALARKLLAKDRSVRLLDLGGAARLAHDPAEVIGTRIGPYRIESMLGRGGMGAVYLARRSDPDASVAIKFITLSRAPAEAIERFRRESQWLAALDHPGVVGYRSSGVDTVGRPYLVMDFVDGQPLSHETEEIAASVARTVAIMIDVADAVHHLHQKGVLHRDLKPHNILLTRRGDTLSPIVIDLGIAREITRADDGAEAATRTPHDASMDTLGIGPIGTPGFMSPEQLGPRRIAPDVRTDVYALGAVLYSLLTGAAPDTNDARLAPPSQRAAATRRIDRDLDAIVLKALATEPEDRYGSAEALAADLRRWQDKLPVLARRIGAAGRLRRWMRRRPFEAVSLALLATTLLGTAIVTSLSWRAERRARIAHQEESAINDAISGFVFERLLARALPGFDGPEASILSVLENGLAESLRNPHGPNAAVALGVGSCLLQIYYQLGRNDDASQLVAQLTQIAPRVAPDHAAHLRFDLARSAIALAKGDALEAERVGRLLWERLDRPRLRLDGIPGAAQQYRLGALQTIGTALEAQDRLDEAEEWLSRGLDYLEGASPTNRILLMQSISFVQQKRGAVDAAIETLKRLCAELEASPSPETGAMLPVLHSNVAYMQLEQDRPDDAQVHAARAVELGRTMYPDPTHPWNATAKVHLGTCLTRLGEYDEALALRREVLAGRERRHGANSIEVGDSLVQLAETLRAAASARDPTAVRSLGDASAEADVHLDRALQIFAAVPDATDRHAKAKALRDESPRATAEK